MTAKEKMISVLAENNLQGFMKLYQEALDEHAQEIRKKENIVRPAVDWFSKEMESKLAINDNRPGWKDCEVSWLLNRLKEKTIELMDIYENRMISMKGRGASENVCITDVSNDAIVSECADVANFAMMVADQFGNNYGQ